MQTLGSSPAERAEAVQSVGRLSGTGPFSAGPQRAALVRRAGWGDSDRQSEPRTEGKP